MGRKKAEEPVTEEGGEDTGEVIEVVGEEVPQGVTMRQTIEVEGPSGRIFVAVDDIEHYKRQGYNPVG
jgi:hypothetical protein